MTAVRRRGYSGESSFTERLEHKEARSVVMAQPHRQGVSPDPRDAWMATALGRACRRYWPAKDEQREYWDVGERYAQLIDNERIACGLSPRQCGEMDLGESKLTLAEQMDRRRDAGDALLDAEYSMRDVDPRAPRAVRRLAYDDLDIADNLHGLTANALYRLKVHFERADKPKR